MIAVDFSLYQWVFYSLILFILVVLALTRLLLGTLNIPSYWREQKKLTALKSRYNRLFESRESMIYHISWAKARGDFEDATRMTQELDALDLVIFMECC